MVMVLSIVEIPVVIVLAHHPMVAPFVAIMLVQIVVPIMSMTVSIVLFAETVFARRVKIARLTVQGQPLPQHSLQLNVGIVIFVEMEYAPPTRIMNLARKIVIVAMVPATLMRTTLLVLVNVIAVMAPVILMKIKQVALETAALMASVIA